MHDVTVYKLDEHGREVWHYPATVLAREPDKIRLQSFFDRDDVDLGYATLARGDRFVETFYGDRWYNVFAIYDGNDDVLKGWYCNVCRPAEITRDAVRCEDLALDVWVSPQGRTAVMDEEEFASLDIPPNDRRRSLEALETLLQLAETGRLPA
ncbi:MAG: DUF402 domain-containing protein [Candidatus Promineifilaceae bacterium]|nr:DUF402 domain-containing protein [Candidatus Promineifilaceae bacterium]